MNHFHTSDRKLASLRAAGASEEEITKFQQQSQPVYHPILGNVVSYGCAICDGTGIVSNQFAAGGKSPCSCVRCRPESAGEQVPTLREAINARRQPQSQHQCSCQQHTHQHTHAQDDAAAAMTSHSLTDALRRR